MSILRHIDDITLANMIRDTLLNEKMYETTVNFFVKIIVNTVQNEVPLFPILVFLFLHSHSQILFETHNWTQISSGICPWLLLMCCAHMEQKMKLK